MLRCCGIICFAFLGSGVAFGMDGWGGTKARCGCDFAVLLALDLGTRRESKHYGWEAMRMKPLEELHIGGAVFANVDNPVDCFV